MNELFIALETMPMEEFLSWCIIAILLAGFVFSNK